MLRRDLLRLPLAGAAVVATRCSQPAPNARQVRMAASPYVVNSGFYVADESGYFRESGIDVEYSTAGRSSEAIPLLASGDIDVASFVPSAGLLNAVAAGARLRVVAARGLCVPNCSTTPAMYWYGNSYPPGIEGLHQLRGRTVAAGRVGQIGEFAFSMVLEAAGMQESDFHIEHISSTEALPALIDRRIEAMLNWGLIDRDVAEISPGLIVGLSLGDLYPMFQYSFITFGARLLDQDPALGTDFLQAYFRGVRAFQDGVTPKFLTDRANDGSAPSGVCRTGIATDPTVHIEDLERFARWAKDKGYSENPPPAEKLFDARFQNLLLDRQQARKPGAHQIQL